MATAGSGAFLAVSLPIALLRGKPAIAATLALLGLLCLGAALYLLRHAYGLRATLLSRRTRLMSQLQRESDS
jgi:hypothetical protein